MTENREQLRLIALRIRDLRDISGLSAQEVASRAGIDEDEYLPMKRASAIFLFPTCSISPRYWAWISAIF